MSFLKKLKGAFKSGVKFSADVSDSFNWRQGEIPVSLTFTGNPEKESTIEKIEFTIRKPTSGGEPDQNSPYYTWEHTEAFPLAAGAQDVKHFNIPLPAGTVDMGRSSRNLAELKNQRDVEMRITVKIEGVMVGSSQHRRMRVVEHI